MKIATGGPVTTLAALLVTALAITFLSMIIPRIPRVLAWRKERHERLILARGDRDIHPSVRPVVAFWTGQVPGHENAFLLPSEEAEFTLYAAELDHGWIRDALRGAERAREQ